MPVCGSGAVVSAWSLLIRRPQRACRQAETPLIVLCRFPGPALYAGQWLVTLCDEVLVGIAQRYQPTGCLGIRGSQTRYIDQTGESTCGTCSLYVSALGNQEAVQEYCQ